MSNSVVHQVSGDIAGKKITLETGYFARQAGGSVLLKMGSTQLLALATMSHEDSDRDFFPLTVDYVEKFYAAGRIPGSYNRREGKPSDHEVLISRLIDRPIRPLFPSDLKREVQIIVMVLSFDPDAPPEAVAGLAASSALAISNIPLTHPIGSVRVVMDKEDQFVINPTTTEMENTKLDLLVSGTKESVTMIEGEADELDEEKMLKAIEFSQKSIREMVQLQEQLLAKVSKEKLKVEEQPVDEDLKKRLADTYLDDLSKAMMIKDKLEREKKTREIYKVALQKATDDGLEEDKLKKVSAYLHDMEADLVRRMILVDKKRNDGRMMDELRPIDCRVDFLESTHGSAVFTRGETQVLSVVALGSERDQQRVDLTKGTSSRAFMLHYNFPPFCVGETGRLGATGRREIGHGTLAERSIARILFAQEKSDFTIRIVSEVLESNGSSSMATICASSMALMSAGVSIDRHIAGVAMGLVKGEQGVQILTDIAGLEDHLGDMDFKVAGTKKGITGFQLDIKVDGITLEIMKDALMQAKKARLQILEKMDKTIAKPNAISTHAPRREEMKIKVDRIKSLIGVGGRNIRNIVDETGSDVSVNDDGVVTIFSKSAEQLEKTKSMIELSVGQPRIGTVYEGKVKKVTPFGVFVEITPGLDGLCHISNFAKERVEDMFDVAQEGDILKVRVDSVDEQGRISLNRKSLL